MLLHCNRVWAIAVLLGALVIALHKPAFAGHQLFRNASVGGVSIDPEGVVREPSIEARNMLLIDLRKDIRKAEGLLNVPHEIRKISLRRLEEAIQEAAQANFGRLPDEIRFLAGLQRIQWIFVYPEQNDIVLAGPAEGWKVDEQANVVGVTSGRPVLQLDDLLVALRTVHAARQAGISCSIDPTEQGRRKLSEVLAQQRRSGAPLNPRALEPLMKEAFGPQQVKLSGVPSDSHFARVLVAADYRMKRLAMNLDKSPVPGLPSYVELIKNSRATSATPRWWLACNYQPLARSEDGLAWELRGDGVKALTEDELITEEGKVKGTGRSSEPARRWAELLTKHYAELSAKDSVFGELRNLMDMCVVAAVIEMNDLRTRAGCPLPLLYSDDSTLTLRAWNAPKTVAPQCSFLRTRSGWIVTASGGVQVESWQVADKSAPNPEMQKARDKAAAATNASWWWN